MSSKHVRHDEEEGERTTQNNKRARSENKIESKLTQKALRGNPPLKRDTLICDAVDDDAESITTPQEEREQATTKRNDARNELGVLFAHTIDDAKKINFLLNNSKLTKKEATRYHIAFGHLSKDKCTYLVRTQRLYSCLV